MIDIVKLCLCTQLKMDKDAPEHMIRIRHRLCQISFWCDVAEKVCYSSTGVPNRLSNFGSPQSIVHFADVDDL